MNAYEHYEVSVAGVPVHFMRKPGRGARPVPLILTHGWPWTFWHWGKVIDPLADPAEVGVIYSHPTATRASRSASPPWRGPIRTGEWATEVTGRTLRGRDSL